MSECTIVSLMPFAVNEDKPGIFPNRYSIDASDTQLPVVATVKDAFYYIYLDDSRGSIKVPVPAKQVAKAIVDDFIQGQLEVNNNASPALFWVDGKLNTDEIKIKHSAILEDVKYKQLNWFTNLCRLADDDWQRYGKHSVISDLQRKAAFFLKWSLKEHPWMNSTVTESRVETVECPACGVKVKKGVIICSACKYIFDQKKYNELKFAL
jgi:hypothetical protein